MLTPKQQAVARQRAITMLGESGVTVTPEEQAHLEIADFGLSRLEELGLQLLVYMNSDRYCAKELILFPRQTCPQHLHPSVHGKPGKEETFRCRKGTVFLYVPGEQSTVPSCTVPADKQSHFTVWHEIRLNAGQQYTIPPSTYHWFQAGDQGAIVSEFSSPSMDEFDVFSDPEISRFTQISD